MAVVAREVTQDTLVYNGRIYTFDPSRTVVEGGAMALSAAGEILAIGQDEPMLATFPDAKRHDLQGKAVFPGLIDAHAHFLGLASALTRADLVGTQNIDAVIERLQDFETTLSEDDWLIGRGWDQNDWPGQQFPSKADLDTAFPDRIVWLERIDGHAGWANSAALAAVDRDLSGDWQPQGGKIHRDDNGAATGIFIDGATAMLDQLAPMALWAAGVRPYWKTTVMSPVRADCCLSATTKCMRQYGAHCPAICRSGCMPLVMAAIARC